MNVKIENKLIITLDSEEEIVSFIEALGKVTKRERRVGFHKILSSSEFNILKKIKESLSINIVQEETQELYKGEET